MQQVSQLSHACLAIDGSQHSHLLLDLAKWLHEISVFKAVTIAHFYYPDKTYTRFQYQKDAIRELVTQRFSSSHQNTSLEIRPVEEGKQIHEELFGVYHSKKCDLMALGFYGLKGQRRQPGDFCSKVRKFLFQTKVDLYLVKTNHVLRDTKAQAVYCFDGSQNSYQGLLKCLDFARSLKAKLVIVHSASPDQTKFTNILKQQLRDFKKLPAAENMDIQVRVLQEGHEDPTVVLLAHLKSIQKEVDVICATRNGYRGSTTNKTFVGDTTYKILTGTTNNILILK